MPVDPQAGLPDALDILAGSISVSYAERMPRETLDAILRTGQFDPCWTGHVMAMVDEAPLVMLARAVASYEEVSRAVVLHGLRELAGAVGSGRIARWMTG